MSSVIIAGDTSGTVTLQAPSAAGSTVINLPSTLGNTGASSFATTDASGNLGLGVTPSSWATLKAASIGATGSSVAGNSNGVYLTQSAYYNAGWKYSQTGVYAGLYQIVDNTHSWSIAGTGTAGNAITFTQAMTLDASGNLLLNTTTASGAGAKMKIETGVGARTGKFLDLTATGGENWIIDSTNTTGSTDVLGIYANGATGMYLSDVGNVGIGTSSPLARLDVRGRSQFSPSSENYAIFMSYNTSTEGVWMGSPAANTQAFYNNAGAERMRIDSSGNLLVGTTSSINGKLQVKNSSGDATTGLTVIESGTNNYWSAYMYTVTHDLYLYYTTANKGYFQSSSGSYIATSDRRLKKDISEIEYGLASVLALRPTSYLMNEEDDASKKHLGFIAQEAQEVIPEVVFDMQDGMLGMDKSAIVPVLVKAIQEQQAMIVSQSELITQLQADVAALKGQA